MFSYKEIILFPNIYQVTNSLYVNKNSGYKEHVFMVPLSSL